MRHTISTAKSRLTPSMSRREFLQAGSATTFAILAAQAGKMREARAAAKAGELTGPLNVMAWEGYDHPALLKGFKELTGVTINVKTAAGNNTQLDELRAGATQFDVANPDATWIEQFAKSGLILPLEYNDFENMGQMFTAFRHFGPYFIDNQMYGVPTRWGINGIVHFRDKLSSADAADGNVLWESRWAKRVSMSTWYNLYISLTAMYLGNHDNAQKADGEELEKVTETLIKFKPNVRAMHDQTAGVKTDLANGDAWIAWGASSDNVATVLRQEGHDVELTLPKQGGQMWTESLVIVKGTPHLETAKAYLNYMTSAKTMALMAWELGKFAVCNEQVKKYLTAEQFKILSLDRAEEWALNAAPNYAPINNEAWKKSWQRFLSA